VEESDPPAFTFWLLLTLTISKGEHRMKSKVLVGLFALVLVLALAPSSFAQVQVRVINTASPSEVASSHHVQTTDPASAGAGILISGEFLAQANLGTVFLTLTFPADITAGCANAANACMSEGIDVPQGDSIRLSGASGLFANITRIWTIDYDSNTIVIPLPSATNNTASGSISLLGVRIDGAQLSGSGPFQVTGALNTSASGYLPTDLTEEVITTTAAAIGLFEVGARALPSNSPGTSTGTFTIFTNRSTPDTTASFRIREGAANLWRTAAQHSYGGSTTQINPTKMRLTFAGVPSGVTLTLTLNEGQSNFAATLSGSTITSSTLSRDITITDASLGSIEEIQIDVAVSVSTTSTTPFAASSITVTIDMLPLGDALTTTNALAHTDVPFGTDGIPRYVSTAQTITLGQIVAANTTLLIPYAVVDNSILYDTGIALANTSKDPFATGGATQTSGTITVHLFPQTSTGAGTQTSFTTSSTKRPGTGLATDGTLAAGGSWVVLLSSILTQEGIASPFTGYIFLEANFLQAHGITFVSSFGQGPFPFTSFSPMLVLAPPAQTSRTSASVESLGF
jgi:hypothetical protein